MSNKKDAASIYMGSTASSFRGSSALLDINPSFIGKGICRDEPLTQTGKRLQLFKMLCLNVLPILGLWAYSVYTLADSIGFREEYLKRRVALYNSIDLGKLVHRLQTERDMSVMYLSSIGPETKSFLLAEYDNTDRILDQVTWPDDLDEMVLDVMFLSKQNFLVYLKEHRKLVTPNAFSVQQEINFYSKMIDTMISWLYNVITESKFSLIWRILVAYQKLASAKENLGVERALGTMFYARGGFESQTYFQNYNERLHSFRAYLSSIGMYSTVVNDINKTNRAKLPENYSAIIQDFRLEIQTSISSNVSVDIRKARFFFDNMTLYFDVLFDIQTQLAEYVIAMFNKEIEELTEDLAINAVLLVVVILICPVVILATESLTSSIQRYALTLVDKTKELTHEKKKTDGLLYQMVPKPVADLLKRKKKVNAEYFKSVTVCFADMHDFDKLTVDLRPMELVDLLNNLYNAVDVILDDFDVYKVETINDCYMVASGLPKRNKDRHAVEIADFTLNMIRAVSEMTFLNGTRKIELRIGINSGPCMAGIVGSLMPRYCLFGDTVNTASRMKAYSNPNKIHLSNSTYQLLKKTKAFTVKKRGNVSIKGKGDMRTYWLMGRVEEFGTNDLEPELDLTMTYETLKLQDPSEMPGEITPLDGLAPVEQEDGLKLTCTHGNQDELPGEITTVESPTYSASLVYPMPGRQGKRKKSFSKKEDK